MEEVYPFHINNGVQPLNAESLDGEIEYTLDVVQGGPAFLLRADISSASLANGAVAAGINADWLLAASVGNPTRRRMTDQKFYIYAANDCIGQVTARIVKKALGS